MLRFFRRFKKKLLDQVSLKKYLVYALGEILLVMVGILLALQVNNWNENRKAQRKERVLLHQLHDEFKKNKLELDVTIKYNKGILRELGEINALFPIDLPSLKNDTSSHEYKTLSRFFNSAMGPLRNLATFNPSNSVINAITLSNNLDLIRNDSLKHKITSWNSVLEDYHENELEIIKLSNDIILPNLVSWGTFVNNALHDKRADLSFLTSPQFETIVRLKIGYMRYRIIPDSIGLAWSEIVILEQMIDDIISLTAEY